jgi:hypothetical protein
LLWFPRPNVEEVGYNLSVLQVGAGADGFVARSWFFNTLQPKAGFDQQIQPLAHRPCEPGSLALRQSLFHLRRRSPEEPFGNLSVKIAEVLPNFNCVGQPVLVAQIPPMQSVEAGVGNGELQETSGLQDAIGYGERSECPSSS